MTMIVGAAAGTVVVPSLSKVNWLDWSAGALEGAPHPDTHPS